MDTSLNVTTIQEALLVASTNVLANIISYIPNLIAAVIVLFLGMIIARWARWLIIKLLETIRLSNALKNSPVDRFLEKAEVTQTVEQVVGNITRWLVLLVFFIAAVNLIGLTTVSSFLGNVLGYVPNVISAALILMVGTLVAGLVESLVKGSVSHVSHSTGRLVSKVASYIVMIFSILAAFAELGIAESLINTLFIGFVAMLAIGFGLSFGLGAKDLIAKILEDWYDNLKKELK